MPDRPPSRIPELLKVRTFAWLVLLIATTSVLVISQTNDPVTHGVRHDPQVDAAFDHFYNMEYDRATQEFERLLAEHPKDPFAVNHLMSVILMHDLYETGGMNTGDYTNDSFIGHAPRPTDPKIKVRIKALAQRAEMLEDERLKANPKDVDALYCRGVTKAQFAVYTGLIERAWFSALRNALGARHDHERVLELDPEFVDAKLVVGTHNYVVGNLPWSFKFAATLAGLSGSREKGLEYLRAVAHANTETSVDAKVILSLFLRREHKYDEALGYMQDLAARYPHNNLFPTEVANLLRASGRAQEAEAMYRKVWQNGREGKYDKLHYEIAAWGLGELFRTEKNLNGVVAAYELVNEAPSPDPDIQLKANLAAGQMYDLMKQRDLAMKRYETVIAENANSGQADQARRYIKEAYRE